MLATTHILPYDGICICHTDQALLYRLAAHAKLIRHHYHFRVQDRIASRWQMI